MKGNEFEYFLDNSINFVNKTSLSTVLAKSSFAFLLLSMLCYWFQAIFNFQPTRKTVLEKVPPLAMWLANLTLATMLSIRWVESGHFPLSNLYESLLFLSWSLTSIHLFLERAFKKEKYIDETSFYFNPRRGLQERGRITPWTKINLSSLRSPETNEETLITPPRSPLPSSLDTPPHLAKGVNQGFGCTTESCNPLGGTVVPSLELPFTAPLTVLASRFFRNTKVHTLGGASSLKYTEGVNQRGYQKTPSVVRQKKIDSSANPPTLTLGAITSPLALFTNAFAAFSLPKEMQQVTVLVPALHSNWLIMHVSVMMVSYAALLSGSLLAMAFLVVRFANDKVNASYLCAPKMQAECEDPKNRRFSNATYTEGVNQGGSKENAPPSGSVNFKEKENYLDLFTTEGGQNNVDVFSGTKSIDLAQTLDNLSYRSIGLGFALLTIGIFSGAVWANEAWGSYWSWDPKETWAFVTWLVFAIYLHTRLSRGWVGKESAFVATFGFLVIWFCYLGVNLFGKGLHSYGWFPSI